MRHHRLNATAKEGHEIVDQLALRHFAGESRFKDMKVADFFDSANRSFYLQAIHGCLNGGVRRAALLREALLDLADGGMASSPQRFHNSEFQFAQSRVGHPISYTDRYKYYTCSRCVKPKRRLA